MIFSEAAIYRKDNAIFIHGFSSTQAAATKRTRVMLIFLKLHNTSKTFLLFLFDETKISYLIIQSQYIITLFFIN